MALNKNYTFKNKITNENITANYWKITQTDMSKPEDTVRVKLVLYFNSAVAAQGGARILTKEFKLKFTPEEMLGNVIATAYIKIKALISSDPQLAGATDA